MCDNSAKHAIACPSICYKVSSIAVWIFNGNFQKILESSFLFCFHGRKTSCTEAVLTGRQRVTVLGEKSNLGLFHILANDQFVMTIPVSKVPVMRRALYTYYVPSGEWVSLS